MRLYVVDGHPDRKSLCCALADSYEAGAKEGGHDVRRVSLRDLEFSPDLTYGYRKPKKLEADLKKQQENLSWCERFVLVTPVWWSGPPALCKGFLERVLLPDFAFRPSKKPHHWDMLLKGRAARVIYTQGAPQLFIRLFRGDCVWQALGVGTLGFCGFKPVERTIFSQVPYSDEKTRLAWIEKVRKLGVRGR